MPVLFGDRRVRRLCYGGSHHRRGVGWSASDCYSEGIWAIALLAITLVLHPPADLDEWAAGWQASVHDSFSLVDLATYTDMARRHPHYFGRFAPTATRSTPKPRDAPRWTGTVEQWRPLVAAYFRPGDVARAMRIMACESGGDPNIQHGGRSSGAAGLFQHLPKYWAARSTAAGFSGVSIFDPTANVATAAWLRDQRGGWKHWVCR